MSKIILTGSEGLIGKTLKKDLLANSFKVICADITLGLDLTNEDDVNNFMKENSDAKYLVNLFAINDHIIKDENKSSLYDIDLDSLKDYCNINLVALFIQLCALLIL